MERIKTPTVGQLKKFFNENNIPDDAEIVMYNAYDEGDCFAGSATYFAPGEEAESGYCQGDSVLDKDIYNFENRKGVVVMFG